MSLGSILSAIFLGTAAQKSAPPINNYLQGRRIRGLPGTAVAEIPKRRLRNQPANYGKHNQQIDPLLAFISSANRTGAVS